MPTNGRRAVAASGELPVDSASQQASSAAAASGLQAGVGADFAAPAIPPGCATSTLLGSVGAIASTCARRYRGKRPPPSLAAEATPHGSATQCRLRDQNPPNRFRFEELNFEAQEEARSACSTPGCTKDAASTRAKFCMTCFTRRASFANAQRKARSGGGGVPGNRGNSGGKGAPGNRGNTMAGREKKLAGERSALRNSTKAVLVVKNPWLDLILAQKKTWEIRERQTQKRGRIHLALSGAGGRIIGQCHLTDSFAVDKSVLQRTYSSHRVKDLSVIRYPRPHAWVLTKARRYEKPFVYLHPQGAMKWVKL